MKANVLVLLVLGCASFAAACSDDTTSNNSGGSGGTGGENQMMTSSAGGSAGAGGAGGGAGGAGGGMQMLSADKLGTICDMATPCPTGYSCVVLNSMSADKGICTLPCTGQTDTMTCSGANGFQGPGQGVCIQASDAMGNMSTICGVICGTQFNLPETCPTGLTCADTLNGNMPGTDGKTDFCIPM